MRSYGVNRSKYRSVKCEYKGLSFDSIAERTCYLYLLAQEQGEEIKILSQQDKVYLTDAKIEYRADFKIFDNKLRQEVWIELKGFETPVWKLKKRLWQHYGPGLLRVYSGARNRLEMIEEISPVIL